MASAKGEQGPCIAKARESVSENSVRESSARGLITCSQLVLCDIRDNPPPVRALRPGGLRRYTMFDFDFAHGMSHGSRIKCLHLYPKEGYLGCLGFFQCTPSLAFFLSLALPGTDPPCENLAAALVQELCSAHSQAWGSRVREQKSSMASLCWGPLSFQAQSK